MAMHATVHTNTHSAGVCKIAQGVLCTRCFHVEKSFQFTLWFLNAPFSPKIGKDFLHIGHKVTGTKIMILFSPPQEEEEEEEEEDEEEE